MGRMRMQVQILIVNKGKNKQPQQIYSYDHELLDKEQPLAWMAHDKMPKTQNLNRMIN